MNEKLSIDATRDPATGHGNGPRVLLVSNSRKVGGGATCLLTYANALRDHGTPPVVVHPERGVVYGLFAEHGHQCEIAPGAQPGWTRPLATWNGTRRWRRLLRDHGIDVVHANDPSTARAVTLACHAEQVPLLCHVHFPVDEPFAEWVFRGLPLPDLFAFCSEALRSETGPLFAQRYGHIPQVVVYNALDTNVFKPRTRTDSTDRTRIGIVAYLVPIKGHEDFLAMAADLVRRGIDAEFPIVGTEGEPGWEAQLRLRACELGIEDRIEFLGYRSDVPNVLNELDVLVCSSHVEPFGRCLVEAMACEVPVVATRVGGIPEAVGEAGLLVPPHSPEHLADAVERLLSDGELRRRMKHEGRARVVDRFGPNALVDHCRTLYETMRTGVRS